MKRIVFCIVIFSTAHIVFSQGICDDLLKDGKSEMLKGNYVLAKKKFLSAEDNKCTNTNYQDLIKQCDSKIQTQKAQPPKLTEPEKAITLAGSNLVLFPKEMQVNSLEEIDEITKTLNNTNVFGFNDWRMPTKHEIAVILLFKKQIKEMKPKVNYVWKDGFFDLNNGILSAQFADENSWADSSVFYRPVRADKVETKLSLSATTAKMGILGGALKINIETNAPEWSYTSDNEWLSIVKSINSLLISVEANKGNNNRVAVISITAEDQTQTITLTQEALQFSLSAYAINFPEESASRTITVTTNYDDWDILSSPSFAKITKNNLSIDVYCTSNPEPQQKGEIVVKVLDKFFTVDVAQAACTKKTASIDSIWEEHNVYQDHLYGMKIHVTIKVHNMLNKKCGVVVSFYKEEGTPLNYSNRPITILKTVTPDYYHCQWKDYTLFIPYNDLHLSNNEHNKLKYVFTINDDENKKIAQSDFNYFWQGKSISGQSARYSVSSVTECDCIIAYEDYNFEVSYQNLVPPMGWRLPTLAELQCLYGNRTRIGNFSDDFYMSSELHKNVIGERVMGITFNDGKTEKAKLNSEERVRFVKK
ncbi:MAG: hypothetical protein LBU51_00015 [Bacteroidales bacterium]|jgi:hypothetical protein|nr:hypothetical protein [Bacteroidales bacterium]